MDQAGPNGDEGPSEPSIPDWRDGEAYRELLAADRAALAWEWLRRNQGYRDDAGSGRLGLETARKWGLACYSDPALDFRRARPMWLAEFHRSVIRIEAGPEGGDQLFLSRFAGLSSSFRHPGGPCHCLLSNGYRSIRFDVMDNWDGASPFNPRFILAGLEEARRHLPIIRQLLAACRQGSLPAPGRGTALARRAVLQLRAHDGLKAGASHRDIARWLIDRDCWLPNWRIECPSARSRAQRLAKLAAHMADIGYRNLLRAGEA